MVALERVREASGDSLVTISQQLEEGKLQGNLDELDHQKAGLRAQLDDLRTQMIELDKRKSSLERMTRNLL